MPEQYLVGHLTAERYLHGLERSAANIQSLHARWDDLDEDLQQHYHDDTEWMLDTAAKAIATAEQRESAEYVVRLRTAAQRLRELHEAFTETVRSPPA